MTRGPNKIAYLEELSQPEQHQRNVRQHWMRTRMAGTRHHAGLLSGCRVLDFTQYVADSTGTRLLTEMRAEIIKVASASVLRCDV